MRWTGKSVDLKELHRRTVEFFRQKKLTVFEDSAENEYRAMVMPKWARGFREEISVAITGNGDDFEVSFVAGDKSRSLRNLGQLTSLLGGGFFMLEGIKSLEALEKLEREFWAFMEETVAQLAGSAEK